MHDEINKRSNTSWAYASSKKLSCLESRKKPVVVFWNWRNLGMRRSYSYISNNIYYLFLKNIYKNLLYIFEHPCCSYSICCCPFSSLLCVTVSTGCIARFALRATLFFSPYSCKTVIALSQAPNYALIFPIIWFWILYYLSNKILYKMILAN